MAVLRELDYRASYGTESVPLLEGTPRAQTNRITAQLLSRLGKLFESEHEKSEKEQLVIDNYTRLITAPGDTFEVLSLADFDRNIQTITVVMNSVLSISTQISIRLKNQFLGSFDRYQTTKPGFFIITGASVDTECMTLASNGPWANNIFRNCQITDTSNGKHLSIYLQLSEATELTILTFFEVNNWENLKPDTAANREDNYGKLKNRMSLYKLCYRSARNGGMAEKPKRPSKPGETYVKANEILPFYQDELAWIKSKMFPIAEFIA